MRVEPDTYLQHDWRASPLLGGFRLEDVWRFPIQLRPNDSLDDVDRVLKAMSHDLQSRGFTGLLFRLRFLMGRVFRWDQHKGGVWVEPGSLREAYLRTYSLPPDALPDPGEQEFVPVFESETERLIEVDNKTVRAAIHLVRVDDEAGRSNVLMAVYVKRKGLLGKAYMALIRPFRRAIVYPKMMRLSARYWEQRMGGAQRV